MNKAEEWMSRVNGQVKVDRGRMVWELMGRQYVEHAAEVWWSGGRSVCRNLKSAQMGVDRRLLGASNTVAGVAVEEAGGEERRDESVV